MFYCDWVYCDGYAVAAADALIVDCQEVSL
jgi:hypothetical protein